MKTDWSDIEQYRAQPAGYESSPGDFFGWFVFRFGDKSIRCMAADGEETGWEHVSVSVAIGKKNACRMPTWEEMAKVKGWFWGEEETVIEIHPPESEYVNNHSYCLHLWKCVAQPFPLPPSTLVGVKELGTLYK